MSRASPGPVNVDDLDHIARICSIWFSKDAKFQSHLRGGQRDVSQAWSETQVEIQDEPVVEGVASTIDQAFGGETTLSDNSQQSPAVKIESPDLKVESSLRYVPLDQHEISQVTYAPAARTSTVISVAHRKSPQVQPTNKAADDDELRERSFTPTQRRLMQRISEGTKIDEKPATKTFQVDKSPVREYGVAPAEGSPDTTQQQYKGPLGFYEEILQQKRKSELATREPIADDSTVVTSPQQQSFAFNPVAEDFTSSASRKSGENTPQTPKEQTTGSGTELFNESQIAVAVPKPEVLTATSSLVESKEDTVSVSEKFPEQDAVRFENDLTKPPVGDEDEARSEGGLDITPILKALGARTEAGSSANSIKAAPINDGIPVATQEHESLKPDIVRPQETKNEEDKIADRELSSQVGLEGKARTVLLSQLPPNIDYSTLATLIYGGCIEDMVIHRDTSTACVTFVNGENAYQYVKSCALGIFFKLHGRSYTILAKLLPETGSPDPVIQAYHSCGATRVVELEDVEDMYTIAALYRLANEPFGCQIECITDNYKSSQRTTSFRFAGIKDAVRFRSMLSHSTQWKKHVIRFGEDPCDKPR